jgi:hypothetical protein
MTIKWLQNNGEIQVAYFDGGGNLHSESLPRETLIPVPALPHPYSERSSR